MNPGKVAEQYCVLLKTALEVPDSWGAAANALEYAVRSIRTYSHQMKCIYVLHRRSVQAFYLLIYANFITVNLSNF